MNLEEIYQTRVRLEAEIAKSEAERKYIELLLKKYLSEKEMRKETRNIVANRIVKRKES
jgi:hypothetical protein